MKRSSQEVAGGPKLRDLRTAVAGRPASPAASNVATAATGAEGQTQALASEEADLLTVFADFMSADEELDLGLLPTPDSTFKERLRRRLWRTFALSYLRGSGGTPH
jgi:hypothetical protein